MFGNSYNKRLGVGASFMGRAGFVGLEAELNLLEEHSALVAVGGGPGYRSFSRIQMDAADGSVSSDSIPSCLQLGRRQCLIE